MPKYQQIKGGLITDLGPFCLKNDYFCNLIYTSGSCYETH